MVTCADTSFLFAVYAHDSHTRAALRWLKSSSDPVAVTALGEFELANALRFAEFRKAIAAGDASVFQSQFEADSASGRILTQVCNLAAVLNEAKRLSATYTLERGHRSFDVLHVASALVMGAEQFLSFDRNQKRLAAAEGLHVPV